MPYKSRMPDPSQGKNLVTYLKSFMDEHGLSIRQLACQTDLSPTYMAEVMRGEKVPDAPICRQISDKLNIPQFVIFRLAGWLDEKDEEIAMSKLQELSAHDAEVQIILNLIEEKPELKREILTTVLHNLSKWKKEN